VPVFSYRATSHEGVIVEGVMEAPEEKTVLQKLKASGAIPLKVTVPKEPSRSFLRLGSRKRDLLTFTMELSARLDAGLPLDRSLNILATVSGDSSMKGTVESVLKSIREGKSFSEALQRHPRVFPSLYVNMVRAGEAGGVVDVVLEKLGEFQESTKELKDHVFSAMIYPIILLITGGLSVVLLLTFVLPRFSVIFAEMGTTLPLPTQILLGFSHTLQSYWWAAALFLGALWFLFRAYVRSEAGRQVWDRLKLAIAGDVIRKLETARFCRTLGTLLRSGVSLLQALNNSRDVMSNRVMASAIEKVSRGAKEGRGIAAPLADAQVFPPLALSMIQVGEETGQLDVMLLKVATTYEKSLKESIKRLIAFLEPAIILGMALVIGFIVVAMLMAIFSITDLPV
jgi:general secretion pathway protein F